MMSWGALVLGRLRIMLVILIKRWVWCFGIWDIYIDGVWDGIEGKEMASRGLVGYVYRNIASFLRDKDEEWGSISRDYPWRRQISKSPTKIKGQQDRTNSLRGNHRNPAAK